MCGILVAKRPSEQRILSIAHRGIEHSTVYKDDLCLVHHRLPIQTVDGDNWSQPIQIGEDRWLLFNGEIFNYGDFESDTAYLQNLFSSLILEVLVCSKLYLNHTLLPGMAFGL